MDIKEYTFSESKNVTDTGYTQPKYVYPAKSYIPSQTLQTIRASLKCIDTTFFQGLILLKCDRSSGSMIVAVRSNEIVVHFNGSLQK